MECIAAKVPVNGAVGREESLRDDHCRKFAAYNLTVSLDILT